MFAVTTSDDLTLGVHDLGGLGQPVLAAHATGFNGMVWGPIAERLEHFHVVAPDFRGHGASTVPPNRAFAWERYADDVLATLSHLGWRADSDATIAPRPIGIGHSMGGAALLLAELRAPGTFAGLWLYEPITFPPELRGPMGEVDNPLSTGARRRRPGFSSRAEAVATYGSKPPMDAFDPAALEAYVEGGFADAPDGTVALSCRPEDEAAVYEQAVSCDAFERAAAVTCPVAVVRGKLAGPGPAAIAPMLAEQLPDARLIEHDELGHFGPMERPGLLAAEISRFAASLGGR